MVDFHCLLGAFLQRNSQQPGVQREEIEKALGKATPGLSRSRVPDKRSVLKLLEPDEEGEEILEGRINSHNPLEDEEGQEEEEKTSRGHEK